MGLLVGLNYPEINIMAFSAYDDQKIKKWFKDHGFKYIIKTTDVTPKRFFEIAMCVLQEKEYIPKIFIVHGHDEELRKEFEDYIKNNLNLFSIVLSEQANKTRSIIEKFEEEGQDADFIFVLLTPDDKVMAENEKDMHYQARQNVIFELGYFIGKLGRKDGKIIVFHKRDVELPTDITGIAYIDITDGVINADEKIRKELGDHLPGKAPE